METAVARLKAAIWPASNQHGWVILLELVVVVAIIAILATLLLRGYGPASSPELTRELGETRAKSMPGAALERARSVECMTNLSQIRQAISLHAMGETQPPPSLEDLRLPPQTTRCPVSGEPYLYDHFTGRVSCPTHPRY